MPFDWLQWMRGTYERKSPTNAVMAGTYLDLCTELISFGVDPHSYGFDPIPGMPGWYTVKPFEVDRVQGDLFDGKGE